MRRMVDLSHHNTVDNWRELKNVADLLCIRCGSGLFNSDKKFSIHAASAEDYKIPFGIYIYSYAKSPTEVKREIERLIEYSHIVEDCKFIVWDREEMRGEVGLNSLLVTIACNEIIDNKVSIPFFVYGDQNYFQTNYDSAAREKIDLAGGRWIARYNDIAPELPCDMWQFTSQYQMKENTGNFDCSYVTDSCYKYLMSEKKTVIQKPSEMIEGKLAIMPKESCQMQIIQKQEGDQILFDINMKYMEG